MDFSEKQISREEIFSGKVVELVVDTVLIPEEKVAKREVVLHNGGVGVLAFDDDQNILLVNQYRYAVGQTLLEIPAGKLEKGEKPAECGFRELLEETGYRAGVFESLGSFYPSPGFSSEVLHLYYAEKLEFVGQNLDPDEYLEVIHIPLSKAIEMVQLGEILDAKTEVALVRYLLKNEKISEKNRS